MNIGTLYGISVGTGDPELITVKGLRLLQKAEIVAFPAGINQKPGIAEQIIAQWLRPEQKTIALNFPYTKDESLLHQAWQQAAKEVWQYLKQGIDVAFACEGDVSFYSTFTYLAQTTQQYFGEVPIITVPGICSPMAAASELQIPLTVSYQSLKILPATYSWEDLEQALASSDVVVLMKVNAVYQKVWQILQRRGLLKFSSLVERATFSDRRIYNDLTDYPNLQLSYFSILIIRVNKT
ncbi:precorrin-2 C20-methyltransferase [Xenococcus sp. PCC 7305]|uniref:precorrin-2 C(20)-methyltransferase n=1 Tax=Xenococcus sp. PCC 7305 TaxID=102125 RepID=UPI0002AC01F2|nr:precorrin-2 C(20)-methyltransferase [Xenococcus sp. PCC 7305]ELS03413.1 precorrin-2 C20-methyltransferase [Xenococcus sp. PCC 7305]